MKRLTTDNPSNNTEAMLNYAYAKDGYVHLSYADGEEDIRLTEYLCRVAHEIGCEFATEENILSGDTCLECDCKVSILNVLAIQAAELRERLKKYEDAEEQGFLTWLPCKVGDTVYRLWGCGKHGKSIAEFEVTQISWYDFGIEIAYRKRNSTTGSYYFSKPDDFGKTVFASREAAEKALEEV